jgi:uncharacterized membrane protein
MVLSARSQKNGTPSTPRVDAVTAERWGASLAGGALALFGLSRRSAPGLALAAAGGALAARTLLRSRADPPPLDQGVVVERTVTVNRPVDALYRYWRDFANLPRILDHLESVTVGEDGRSHWVAKAPLGTRVEWDAELVEDRPNELISWQSIAGSDVPNRGSVRFAPAPLGRGSEVTVMLAYDPPAGGIGAALAKVFGEEPDQQVREDLRRFKAVMEAGEAPTTDGQPSGREG